MPIYQYRCASCGREHEALQKVSDAPLTVCPHCGKPELTKMLTAAGFQLKGSGWYATDFRNKGTAPAKAADTKSDSKPSEGKSDGGGGSSAGSGGSCGAGGCSAC